LPNYSVFTADALLYAVTSPLTLWPWSPTLKCWNSVPNLNEIEQYAAELLRLLRFRCLTLWPWTLHYVLLSVGPGGEIAVVFRQNMKCSHITIPECKTFETICVRLTTATGPVIIVNIYH